MQGNKELQPSHYLVGFGQLSAPRFHFVNKFYAVSSKNPTLPQLLKIKLPSRVAPKINDFGTFLLKDDIGNKMTIISENCRGRPEEMAREVLKDWLLGKGVEVSWDSLIATLRDCELPLMAEQIQMALNQL